MKIYKVGDIVDVKVGTGMEFLLMHVNINAPINVKHPQYGERWGVSGGLALKTRPRGGTLDFPLNATMIMAKKVLVQFKGHSRPVGCINRNPHMVRWGISSRNCSQYRGISLFNLLMPHLAPLFPVLEWVGA